MKNSGLGPANWPLGAVVPMQTALSTGLGPMPDPGEVENDSVLQAFRLLGRVQGPLRGMTMGWGFDVVCPWVEEHTARTASGTGYVPITQRFHCHHGHCQTRDMSEVRLRLDELLRTPPPGGPGTTLAALEFDAVDPGGVALPGAGGASQAFSTANRVVDPWEAVTPPAWPGGVHTAEAEDEIARCAAENGFDHAGLATAMLAAGSAVADKRLVLRPYQGAGWTVPPIVWVMLVGDSGTKKTPIWQNALRVLRRHHHAAMSQWEQASAQYRAQPLLYRQITPPPVMMPLLVTDATVESAQAALGHTPRGIAYLRDELSAVLDFDRYAQSNGGGQSGRAFYLESYEAGSFTLLRVKRGGLYLRNCGMMIGGGLQPAMMAGYIKATGDGLLQRFCKVKITAGPTARAQLPGAGGTSGGLASMEAAIERLLSVGPAGDYTTTPDGEGLIHEMEAEGRALARVTDLGPAFVSEAYKMHGLLARVALVLHLLDTPAADVVPTDTVIRAARFVRFIMAHSAQVYAEGETREGERAIASFLLRTRPSTVSTRDLMRNVAICRHMTTKEMNAAIEPLVDGGWVKPAEPYPTNREWLVNPHLQEMFPERLVSELERVAAVKEAMNQLGRYR